MKQRIEYIDAIKGLAIFLMVMGHAIAWNYDDYNAVCNFHPEQTINVKMGGGGGFGNLSIFSIFTAPSPKRKKKFRWGGGGGDLATYLFFPYAIIFYGIRFFDV